MKPEVDSDWGHGVVETETGPEGSFFLASVYASPSVVSVTPWTVAHQATLSKGFSRQEYWVGLPFPSPGDLPNPGIKPGSPALQADSLPSEPTWKPLFLVRIMFMAMRRWEGQKLGSGGVLAGPSLWVAVIGGWKCLELLRM